MSSLQWVPPEQLEQWHLDAIRTAYPEYDPYSIYSYWWLYPPPNKQRAEALNEFHDLFALARLRGKAR